MKVCAVIVTYGNRFHLLGRVVEACVAEGVDKIIIVDNNSECEEQLQALNRIYAEKLNIATLKSNIGSAGGYKYGLEIAAADSCDYIWLLDDDNRPKHGALEVLKKYWQQREAAKKTELVALLSFRPDRTDFRDAVRHHTPELVLGRKNSFLGFHIFSMTRKIFRQILNRPPRTDETVNSGVVAVAPYGGMFFHKTLLQNIGYPDEKLFLYADDHEWSYRITRHGGSIILLLDSVIEDIDTSWNVSAKKFCCSAAAIANGPLLRVYYSIRNRMIFERHNLITFGFAYLVNMYIYRWLILFFVPNKKAKKVIKKALKDGMTENLHENFDI